MKLSGYFDVIVLRARAITYLVKFKPNNFLYQLACLNKAPFDFQAAPKLEALWLRHKADKVVIDILVVFVLLAHVVKLDSLKRSQSVVDAAVHVQDVNIVNKSVNGWQKPRSLQPVLVQILWVNIRCRDQYQTPL